MGFVADFFDGAAVNDVADEPMAVGGHRDEVAAVGFGGAQDFRRGISEGQLHGYFQACLTKPDGRGFEVFPVHFHLLAFGQFEFVEMARGPAICHVHEE